MVPIVYKGTENTIVPVLEKVIDGKPLDPKDNIQIEKWGVLPAAGKGGGYKGDMCLSFIIRKWFEDHDRIK